jgi:hypothetical protein
VLLPCLAFLRYKLGTDWSGVLEPFSVDPKDPVDTNRAANRLAAHAGLRGLRFIVGVGRLESAKGGIIELRAGQEEVFIDVATDAGAFGPSLLAVLAHEISHKVLFDRHVHQEGEDPLRYEILTDMTAVYLGFGKLMLNGYEYGTTRHNRANDTVEKRRVRFGYISVEEVAFMHAMVCRMREIPPSDWLGGLSPFARRIMTSVVGGNAVRHHLDSASMLIPQTTYLGQQPRRQPSQRHVPGNTAHHARIVKPKTPGAEPGRSPGTGRGLSPEVDRLRNRLLELVYGDERLAGRLVAFEQRSQVTLEASYEAAIERLIRDRS